jgi:UDP-N-acetylmuramyl pentapeptide synthase
VVRLSTKTVRGRAFRVVAGAVCVAALAAGVAVASIQVSAADAAAAGNQSPAKQQAWSFGVISDTQWTIVDDGYNPNTVGANIIKQIDQQFIQAGVDLVVAVGDTVNVGSQLNIDTRALYAQDLYNAGVGFYPLRGNHEAAEDPNYKNSGLELRYAFPQIGTV